MKRSVQFASATYTLLISLVGGAILLLGAPSFWYIACALVLLLAGVTWFFRPAFGGGFAIPPLIGLTFLFRYTGLTRDSLYLSLILATALLLAVLALKRGVTLIAL